VRFRDGDRLLEPGAEGAMGLFAGTELLDEIAPVAARHRELDDAWDTTHDSAKTALGDPLSSIADFFIRR
jgi:hypothetical protein